MRKLVGGGFVKENALSFDFVWGSTSCMDFCKNARFTSVRWAQTEAQSI